MTNNFDKVVRCVVQGVELAQEKDKKWAGRWRRPPEYLLTTSIAATLDEELGESIYVELENNVRSAVREARGEIDEQAQQSLAKNGKFGILLIPKTRDTPKPIVIELKNGEHGFEVVKKDVYRLCEVLRIGGNSIKGCLMVIFIFVTSKDGNRKSASIRAEQMREKRIDETTQFVEGAGDLKCRKYACDVHGNEENAWTLSILRIYR